MSKPTKTTEEKLNHLYAQMDRATTRAIRAQREMEEWDAEIVTLTNLILPLQEQLLAQQNNTNA
jgi:hypothetical protein